MPGRKENVHWIPNNDILTFAEIERISRILVQRLGIEKIKLTGGEPLLRENIENLISLIAQIDGLKRLDMTTNGWFLPQKAKALRDAGLQGITISLHSIKRETSAQIAGGIDVLERVLEGIDSSIDAGFSPVKINTVIIRGYNDNEIVDIVKFARSKRISIQFIEFMPLDGTKMWQTNLVVSGSEIYEKISKYFKLVPMERKIGDTAVTYEFEDGLGEVGLIMPISKPFCDDCDRIRLTADGKLLTCLFDTQYHDLKHLIRKSNDHGGNFCRHNRNNDNNNNGIKSMANDDEIANYIVNSIKKKPPGIAYSSPLIKNIQRTRAMHAIGG